MPPFQYACPTTLSEAVALLASRDDAKLLAGGQSLVPMLAFRLAQPTLLVDLRKLADLREIKISAEGVRLGAMVRWRDILDDERLVTAHPLLKAAVAEVAHYQIRNRGTVGGSMAHADPAAEMPGIAVTCEAEIHVRGKSGSRMIKAGEFFVGPLMTALAADETGRYIGRICHYRECHPRVLCRAQHCGGRQHLNDDLQIVTLAPGLIASPPIELWPRIVRSVPVPVDTEELLLAELVKEA